MQNIRLPRGNIEQDRTDQDRICHLKDLGHDLWEPMIGPGCELFPNTGVFLGFRPVD